MALLQIEHVTFCYPDAQTPALEDVSLTVRAGEFLLLCGESGCGKSTLLKLLKREIAPFGDLGGRILLDGTEQAVLDERTAASAVGFVGQDPEAGIVTDTVWHELAFGLESLGCEQAVIRRRVAEMASYFGIEHWFHQSTNALSGGQKQLLNLASVMAMQPKLLLLDEPTAQLDPIAAANFIATLQKLNRELGVTVILAEHRLEEVFSVADRVLLMGRGRLLYADAPRGISDYFKHEPAHPMIEGLPAAMRIFAGVEADAPCPLTVREGRAFLAAHFDDRITRLDPPPERKTGAERLALKDVWFRYQKDLPDVLCGVSLSVFGGEHLCILGGNGVGKSTALGVLAGVLKPYRGRVLLDGKPIGKAAASPRIALLPQDVKTVFLEKMLREDLTALGRAVGLSAEACDERIAAVCDRLDITPLLERHPYDLSGGEQQKAALAKLLLLEPDILLLDEPTKGIDPSAKRGLAAILRRLTEEGVAIVTVTHDVEFAAANADRCALFFDGGVASADTPTAFFGGNHFYTTAANRIARGRYENAVLCEDVIALCRANGRKGVDT